MNCNCLNCQTVRRWENVYWKPFLAHGGDKDWAEKQMAEDRELLPCAFANLEKRHAASITKIDKLLQTVAELRGAMSQVKVSSKKELLKELQETKQMKGAF